MPRSPQRRQRDAEYSPIIWENIALTGIADKGKAVGRQANDPSGKVVFVEGGVPGDVADVHIFKSKKEFAEGKVVRVVQPSPDRVTAFCEHFGVCGGCKWQYLAYPAQLRHKQQTVDDALRRLGKLEVGTLLPIIGAHTPTDTSDLLDGTRYYRNKLEFSFSSKRWMLEAERETDRLAAEAAEADPDTTYEAPEEKGGLGFHRAGSFEKVVDIDHCYLQPDPSNALRNSVRDFALEHNYPFYAPKSHTGWLRNMMVRTSSLGEVMVMMCFSGSIPDAERDALMAHLVAHFPNVTSWVYVMNGKRNDTVFDLPVHTYAGRDHIFEQLGSVRYKVSPKSFFQTNTAQALELYRIVANFADLKGSENVYDLYTGTGSIACFVAHTAANVVGIEEVDMAVTDARENAALNDLHNVTFYTGDVKNILTPEFATQHGKPDVVITDPPRAGMHENVVRTLLALAAPRIVYVSCNPATQARDMALLTEKYRIVKVQPVDMFPQTHHIESVALLELL